MFGFGLVSHLFTGLLDLPIFDGGEISGKIGNADGQQKFHRLMKGQFLHLGNLKVGGSGMDFGRSGLLFPLRPPEFLIIGEVRDPWGEVLFRAKIDSLSPSLDNSLSYLVTSNRILPQLVILGTPEQERSKSEDILA